MNAPLKNILTIPDYLKPREKLMNSGANCLTNSELAAILIGSGTKGARVDQIANKLSFYLETGEKELDFKKLCEIRGIGKTKACSILAALELSRRKLAPSKKKISTPSDLVPFLSSYKESRQEHFFCASLNGAHEIIKLRLVTKGLLNRTIIHPREVFADPLTDRAAAILVAHNHPSGNLQPSMEDTLITEKLKEAGELLGISLLDHVIFGETGYYSFLEAGKL